MAKTKEQKREAVKQLIENIKNSKGLVFANFQGLTVEDSQKLRRDCRQQGINVLASKKTLVKLACKEAGIDNLDPMSFEGSIATFTSDSDEVSPAKTVNDFAKIHDIVTVFGGVLEGNFIAPQEVKKLAALPGKQEMLGKLVATVNAPVSGFVNALAGNLRNLVGVLNNIKESKA